MYTIYRRQMSVLTCLLVKSFALPIQLNPAGTDEWNLLPTLPSSRSKGRMARTLRAKGQVAQTGDLVVLAKQ